MYLQGVLKRHKTERTENLLGCSRQVLTKIRKCTIFLKKEIIFNKSKFTFVKIFLPLYIKKTREDSSFFATKTPEIIDDRRVKYT